AGRNPARLRGTIASLRERLRRGCYDVSVDLQSTLKSAIVARLAKARRRVGFAPTHTREWSFFFTNEWARPSSPHLNRVDRNLEMAALLGAAHGPVDAALAERPAEAGEAEQILMRLGLRRGLPVILCPGASRRQAFKRWPASAWSRLAFLLAGAGRSPVVVWGPG